jgi:hypothetical protein
MPIQCQICNQEFPNQITWSHLKTHSITTAQYKQRYGAKSMASDEYRAMRSQQSSGKNNANYGNTWTTEQKQTLSKKLRRKQPWNKGARLQDTAAYKKAAQNREQRYASGDLTRITPCHTRETRQKISESMRAYAQSHPEEFKQRATRAVQTKILRDFDFGAPMRGKQHSEETKLRLKTIREKNNQRRSQISLSRAKNTAANAQCHLLSVTEKRVAVLQCMNCNSEFEYTMQYLTATAKISTALCAVCHPRHINQSAGEKELTDFIKQKGIVVFQNYTGILGNRKEVDIYIPEKNIAIEYNGLFWHSEQLLEQNGQHKHKDFFKYKDITAAGTTLITVYEDEWKNKQDIVKSRIAALLGVSKKIGARTCIIKEISSKQANDFLNKNHIQGSGRSNKRYGLFHNNQLITVMTFSKQNISRKIHGWELDRFCHKQGYTVIGGASKLFSYFCTTEEPEQVISYSDNRWGNGVVYERLGMVKQSIGVPNYWYFRSNEGIRYHRYGMRKSHFDNPQLTEWQNRCNQGWNRVWDCGHSKWVWQQ